VFFFVVANRDINIKNDDLCEIISSKQEGGSGYHCREEDEEGDMSKPNKESKRDGPAGGGSRPSGNNHNRNNGQQKPMHRSIIIPEARVIQVNNEFAYISEEEVDDREYRDAATKDQIKDKANNGGVGGRQQSNARCLCFDCWAGPSPRASGRVVEW
jgi:hypothetical protein